MSDDMELDGQDAPALKILDPAAEITSFEAWNTMYIEGVVAELPESGFTVRLRPLSLKDAMVDAIARGYIVDELTPMLNDLAPALSMDDNELLNHPDQVGRLEHFINPLVCAALALNPVRVVMADPAPPGCIPVGRLPFSDRIAIFTWLNAEGRDLRPFREEPAPTLVAVDRQPALRDQAEPTAGGDQPLGGVAD